MRALPALEPIHFSVKCNPTFNIFVSKINELELILLTKIFVFITPSCDKYKKKIEGNS